MLFDLSSGKRRRVIQVVYATLAILMGGSLVFFGIGSDAPGGLLDAVGLGSNSDNSSDSGYEDQIEDAESKLETNPSDPAALRDLARYHYLDASEDVVRDETTGQITEIPPEARSGLEQSVDAWQRYLDTDPAQPDASVAQSAASAYVLLGDAEGAADAQRIVAEDQNTAPAYSELARFLYADFQFKAADEAAAKTVQLADASQSADLRKTFEQMSQQAHQLKEQQEKAAEEGGREAGEQQLTDPFGALGGSGSAAPTTPAP